MSTLKTTNLQHESAADPTIVLTAAGEATIGGSDILTRAGVNASGSAPIYSCRAWVNFNGTGTVAIRDSGNVSSITDHGTGSYTINFTTNLPDTNYTAVCGTGGTNGSTVRLADSGPNLNSGGYNYSLNQTTSSLRVLSGLGSSSAPFDADYFAVAVFR